jgi:hypothetical protein
VSGYPGMDDQCFGIPHVGKVTTEFQVVDHSPDFFDVSSLRRV